MRVGVQCELDLAMSQNLHHHSWVDPLRHQEGSARVPEVVKALLRQPCPIEYRLEVAGDISRVQGRPDCGGEHYPMYA